MKKLFFRILLISALLGVFVGRVNATQDQTKTISVGRLPILEIHHIDVKESRWGTSVDQFKKDLLWLYNNGYQLMSLEDYVDGKITVAAGKKPVILTFDDGLISQFKYLPDGSIDPTCAIGILDSFYNEHPDFGRAATFFVNDNPFGQKEFARKKMEYLHQTGRQVGYHTLLHTNLSKVKPEEFKQIFIDQTKALKPLLPEGMRLDTLAYPYGGVPKVSTSKVMSGSADGVSYEIKLALLVGADPAKVLADGVDPYRVPRIQGIDDEWLRHFNRQPGETGKNSKGENFKVLVAGEEMQNADTNLAISVNADNPVMVPEIKGHDLLPLFYKNATTWIKSVPNLLKKSTQLWKQYKADEVELTFPPFLGQPLRGIYLTAYSASSNRAKEYLQKIQENGGNMVVVDFKETDGHLYYPTQNQISIAAGGNDRVMFKDPADFIKTAHEKGIYVVARVTCFKDELMAVKKPEWAIRDYKGNIWKSPEGQSWLDPSLPEVQDYVISVAEEVSKFGVDEIQFDYVRFPTQGAVNNANYSFDEKKVQKYEIIRDFLKKAREKLNPLNVKLGIDVYGVVAWHDGYDSKSTGQKIEELAPYTDVIYPMIYPSHFGPGFGGKKNPADEPYYFVSQSLKLFQKLIGKNPVQLRPWLQGFALHVTNFSPSYMQKQVKAVYNTGFNSFAIWNAANRYDVSWGVLK